VFVHVAIRGEWGGRALPPWAKAEQRIFVNSLIGVYGAVCVCSESVVNGKLQKTIKTTGKTQPPAEISLPGNVFSRPAAIAIIVARITYGPRPAPADKLSRLPDRFFRCAGRNCDYTQPIENSRPDGGNVDLRIARRSLRSRSVNEGFAIAPPTDSSNGGANLKDRQHSLPLVCPPRAPLHELGEVDSGLLLMVIVS
jgi:hypothetical protein